MYFRHVELGNNFISKRPKLLKQPRVYCILVYRKQVSKTAIKNNIRRGTFGLNQLSKHGVLTKVSISASSHDGAAGRAIWLVLHKPARNQGKP